MAFINDEMAVVTDQIDNLTIARQTLDYANINDPSGFLLATANDANSGRFDIKKNLEPCEPDYVKLGKVARCAG